MYQSNVRKRSRRLQPSKDILGADMIISTDEEYKLLEKAVLGTGQELFKEASSSEDSDEEQTKSHKKKRENFREEKKPAWIDEDDEHLYNEVLMKQNKNLKGKAIGEKNYQNVMEKKFKEIMGVPKWSQTQSEKYKATDNLLSKCGDFIKKSKALDKGTIVIRKVKSLNHGTKLEGPYINVLKFHTKSMVAMVAGTSGIVSLYQVDGQQNTKLQSVKFDNFPIFCGSFLKNGEEFLVGSRYHKHFYCHNMLTGRSMKIDTSKISQITRASSFCVSPTDDFIAVCGHSGQVHLFTVTTKEYIDTLQMNCDVTAISFNGDGSLLFSHGTDGEVYVWNMRSRTCVKKFIDDGCLKGSSIAISDNNQFVACGSSSGVVNIYGADCMDVGKSVVPTKTIYNLVTPITSVKFNSTGEILALASNHRKAAMKLVHCSSMTVFSNFPSFECVVQNPMSVDFSVNSGYFGVGDNNGHAHLFRLKHYGDY